MTNEDALEVYLALESDLIKILIANGECDKADAIRDQMDPVWYRLTEQQRNILRNRPNDPSWKFIRNNGLEENDTNSKKST
jgi:hypothetical protein